MATYGTMNSAGRWSDVAAEKLPNMFARILARESWVAERKGRAPMTTVADVEALLASGADVHYDDDWYAVLRQKHTAPIVAPAPAPVACDCGHAVAAASVMHASLGTSCPDCYDRLSDAPQHAQLVPRARRLPMAYPTLMHRRQRLAIARLLRQYRRTIQALRAGSSAYTRLLTPQVRAHRRQQAEAALSGAREVLRMLYG